MFILSLLLLFFIVPLDANMDARIDAIQKAPIEERFRLMNQFKQEISQMNEEARINAITKLKSITHSEHTQKAIKELKQHAKSTNVKQICKTHKYKERCEKNELFRHHKDKYELESGIENETENHAEEGIENEVQESIENETEEHIENETEESIENETEDHIEDETEDHMEDEHDDDD